MARSWKGAGPSDRHLVAMEIVSKVSRYFKKLGKLLCPELLKMIDFQSEIILPSYIDQPFCVLTCYVARPLARAKELFF